MMISMKTQRLAIVLTVINLIILMSTVGQTGPARTDADAGILRGRGLEIVDEHGKIRAQIIVTPPTTGKDGKKYAETVLLRLIDPNGRPGVKIGASVDGTGLSLDGRPVDQREWSGVQILAEPAGSVVKLTNKDGREQVIKP
jgi:hypothetical protein